MMLTKADVMRCLSHRVKVVITLNTAVYGGYAHRMNITSILVTGVDPSMMLPKADVMRCPSMR